MLKKLFHIFNSLLVILYLFPGSIIGYFLYRDFSQQPQLTSDFLSLSSNHVYTFIVFTILGVLAFKDLKKLGVYLIITSIFLEILHLYIPNRSFQFSDLFGNLIGVITTFTVVKTYKFWRKK